MKHESLPLTQREWWISDADPLSTSRSCTSRGFSVVEILLAVSVFALLVTTLFGAYFYGQESSALSGNRTRATLLAEEGIAAVRNIRDAGFANLVDGTHGLSTSGNRWSFSGTSDATDIFTRQVVISSLDSHRKNITSTVTWQQNPERTGNILMTTRLTDWLRSNSNNWNHISQKGKNSLSGNMSGVKVVASGTHAYAVGNNNNTSNFVSIDVSDVNNPTVSDVLDLDGTPSNIAVAGNYAYVTSSSNSEELQIVNISNPNSLALVGSFNAAGNANGEGVAISGSYAYLVRASSSSDEFYTINISNPSSPTSVGSLDFGATGNEIVILGSNAYIASSDNSAELMVVSVAVPALPVVIGALDLPSNTNAKTIAGFGSTILIGAGSVLYTVNAVLPVSPAILGSFDVEGSVNDIDFNADNTVAFIADSNRNKEFQVIDISSLASPMLLASIDISGNQNLYGVMYDVNTDTVYAVGDKNSEEFMILQP